MISNKVYYYECSHCKTSGFSVEKTIHKECNCGRRMLVIKTNRKKAMKRMNRLNKDPLHPFGFMNFTFSIKKTCRLIPTAWRSSSSVQFYHLENHSTLTDMVYWQWLWFHLKMEPLIEENDG